STLAPLDASAASGVPTDAVLTRDLLALLPQLAPASAPTASPASSASGGGTGLLNQLASNASKLVHVERAETPVTGSTETTAQLQSIADAARRNDLARARSEVEKLPADLKARAQPWLDRVAARDSALNTAAAFSSAALAALS